MDHWHLHVYKYPCANILRDLGVFKCNFILVIVNNMPVICKITWHEVKKSILTSAQHLNMFTAETVSFIKCNNARSGVESQMNKLFL